MATEGKRSPTSHRTPAQIRAHTAGYKSTPAQKKKNAQRKRARRLLEKEGKVTKGDGKTVGHKKMIKNGGGNARSNLAVQSAKKNYGHGTSPGGSAPSKKKRSKPTKKRK